MARTRRRSSRVGLANERGARLSGRRRNLVFGYNGRRWARTSTRSSPSGRPRARRSRQTRIPLSPGCAACWTWRRPIPRRATPNAIPTCSSAKPSSRRAPACVPGGAEDLWRKMNEGGELLGVAGKIPALQRRHVHQDQGASSRQESARFVARKAAKSSSPSSIPPTDKSMLA